MDLLQQFQKFVTSNSLIIKGDRLLIGVSGGADSVVLADLCKRSGYDFAVAHVNFQLRDRESNADELFVKEMALAYEVPFFSTTFDTRSIASQLKTGIEETARNLRYDRFQKIASDPTFKKFPQQRIKILTAHHADDNAETILMNFVRGTGVKGLRGILAVNRNIIRPLLFANKAGILQYAEERKLLFRTDSTNCENDFTRNYFRNIVIPSLEKVYPAAKTNITGIARRMKDTEEITEAFFQLAKNKLVEKKGSDFHIPVNKILKMPGHATVLYEILKGFDFNSAQSREAEKLLTAGTGKYVASATHRVIRNRAWLAISELSSGNADVFPAEKETEKIKTIDGSFLFSACPGNNTIQDPGTACLDMKAITYPMLIRRIKTGDYFYPLGMKKKKKLSRFLIDSKISAKDKEKIWVVESDKRIIWIAGMRIDERAKVHAGTKEVMRIRFLPAE